MIHTLPTPPSDEIQSTLSRLEEHYLRKQESHQAMMAQMEASHV